MDEFKFFMPLSKVEKQEDGSRMVTGYASTPAMDLDGEIVTLSAVKKALPSYMEWKNIRQMHQDIAVGVAKEAHVDEDGLYLRAKIVDPTCIKLIDEEVLKGFSIGGKKLRKVGNEIREISLIEISVVDRPANGQCRFEVEKMAKGATLEYVGEEIPEGEDTGWFRKTIDRLLTINEGALAKTVALPGLEEDPGMVEYETLSKKKFTQPERDAATTAGEAMPGGGFPIKNPKDVQNAVQAFGRAKDPEATKKHIIRRAKSVGATDLLPKDWEGSTLAEKEAMADFFKSVPEGDFAWPHFAGLAKSAPNVLGPHPEVVDRLAKGLGTLGDLAYAFSSIRQCQRRLIAEGAIEKDGDDVSLAARLGQVASELASVISEKAQHEASEAVYLTDADDLTSYTLVFEGPNAMTLNANKDDLAKRAAGAVRGHMDKVAGHLAKAMSAHADAMKCLGKAGSLLAGDVSKAASTAGAMDELKNAAVGFMKAADEMQLSKAAAVSAVSSADVAAGGPAGAGAATGVVSAIAQSTMTEGDVKWYDACSDYFAAAGAKDLRVVPGMVTQAQAEAMAKAAVAEAKVELLTGQNKDLQAILSKTPGGDRKGRVFPVLDKGVMTGHESGEKDKNSILLDGVNLDNIQSPDDRRKAASTMVANMIGNPKVFAKSLFDPSFRGGAGMKRTSS